MLNGKDSRSKNQLSGNVAALILPRPRLFLDESATEANNVTNEQPKWTTNHGPSS